MDESYDLPLDLAEISKQACLSRYHFLRLFRDTFDTTPHQYLIRRRIDKAKELLRSRRLRVIHGETPRATASLAIFEKRLSPKLSMLISNSEKEESRNL